MPAIVQRAQRLSAAEHELMNDAYRSAQAHVEAKAPAERLAAQIDRLETRARSVREGRELGLAGLGRMANGAIIFSALGEVLFSNNAAVRLLGLQPHDRSRTAPDLLNAIQPPLGQSWLDIWRGTVLRKESYRFEGYTDEGTPLFVAVEPLEGDRSQSYAPFWVVTLADLSQIRSAQAQREEALAFLSHDIRAPLDIGF